MEILSLIGKINFEYIIVGLIFAVLYMVWSLGIKPSIQRKEISNLLDEVATKNDYKFSKANGKYDYVLEANKENKYKKILIRVINVPKVSTITVNSKNTWNLHYGGSGAPGKGFMYQRYLNELRPFLNMNVESDELKLILVYKNTMKIQRYLNESELEIIKSSDKVYDYKIIAFADFNNHFNDL